MSTATMDGATTKDPWLRAPHDLDLVPDEQLAGVVDRRLRSIRRFVEVSDLPDALRATRDLSARTRRRLDDEDLAEALDEIAVNLDLGEPTAAQAVVTRLLDGLLSEIAPAVAASRAAVRPKRRKRWVPHDQRHLPKRTPEEWAAERAAEAEAWAEANERRRLYEDALAAARAAVPWGTPTPRPLWRWPRG